MNRFQKKKVTALLLTLASTLITSCTTSHNHSAHSMNMSSSSGTNYTWINEGDFSQKLNIPALADTLHPELVAQNVSGGLGYSAQGILGPTILLRSGQIFQLTLKNQLSEATNLHWHGLDVPVAQDGLPEHKVESGSNKSYSFTIKNRAGLYWYHPHLMGSTAKQAYQGLAGLMIVRDSIEDALKLPSGEFEIPLVLQDKRSSGMAYNPSMAEVMSGFLGDQMLVNGAHSPFMHVKKGSYRLRILNGSNARVYDLAFADGRSFSIIGSDGGLLEKAVQVDHALVGPGERLDLIVSFAQDSTSQQNYLISRTFSGGIQGAQSFKILKIITQDSLGMTYQIPAVLSSIAPIPSAAVSHSFELAMTMEGMSGMSGMKMMGMHTINGQIYDSARFEATVKPESIETWEFVNKTDEIHPIHFHGLQFQLKSRSNGRTLLPQEMGFKDTFVLLPNESATLSIKFSSELGRHLFHCHNLEHEEDGMMAQYLVTP
jgi:blue copper oxidase